MKKIAFFLILALLISCSSNNDIEVDPVAINFTFSHSWQETEITNSNFADFNFINENGETISSIERLRYVVSDVILTHESGVTTSLSEHKLIDVTNDDITFTTTQSILPGNYTSVSIRFGLSADYNIDDAYPDLNTASFNVPDVLGGGYHYMQFDGNFLDANNVSQPFNFHAIPAVDTDISPLSPEDTSVQLNIGAVNVTGNTTVNINMDLYEWFSNPNTWDLNQLSVALMPNYSAQVQIAANASSAFSLVSIIP